MTATPALWGVTISAGYGAAGSIVAPAVAARLGLPLLDRAINSRVAEQLHVSVEEADNATISRSFADRFFALLAPLARGVLGAGTDAAPPNATPEPTDAALFRDQAHAVMASALSHGAVILGRGGSAAFREEPHVLKVRLFGPPDSRATRGASAQDIDIDSARQRMQQVDRARDHYVRRLYGVSIDDPALFHLHIDSCAISPAACTDLIVTAYLDLHS